MKQLKAIIWGGSLLIFVGISFGQFKSQLPKDNTSSPITGQSQDPFISILDPNRLTLNHGFSLNFASFGGRTLSTSVYSNKMRYLISDNWSLDTRFDFVKLNNSSFQSIKNGLNGQIYYGAQLQYRPSQNFLLNVSFDNYPSLYYRPISGFSPYQRIPQ